MARGSVLEGFLELVPYELRARSGAVFYSGRSAFTAPSPIYVLGLNPGGSPVTQASETIELDIAAARSSRNNWSAYQDESWQGKPPGTHGMQPRVLHLLRGLGFDPRAVPASNVVFVRSSREADLIGAKAQLLSACWPVHRTVIDTLKVRTIICFGGTSGSWVREALGADRAKGRFVEENQRKWTCVAHESADGMSVITLTHPSIAKWDAPETDPTAFVSKMMNGFPA